jgi:hypothetical protein
LCEEGLRERRVLDANKVCKKKVKTNSGSAQEST